MKSPQISAKAVVDTAKCGIADAFYGSVTVGERGQIVIPAEARADFDIHPGDKLLVMKHPVHKGLTVFKFEAMRQFLDELELGLARVKEQVDGDEGGDHE